MTQAPSRATRQGCQTRINAVASLVGELKGEDCACQIESLTVSQRTRRASGLQGFSQQLQERRRCLLGLAATCSGLAVVLTWLPQTAFVLLGARVFSAQRLDTGGCVDAAGPALGCLYLAKGQRTAATRPNATVDPQRRLPITTNHQRSPGDLSPPAVVFPVFSPSHSRSTPSALQQTLAATPLLHV
jgi:hypothetical protein